MIYKMKWELVTSLLSFPDDMVPSDFFDFAEIREEGRRLFLSFRFQQKQIEMRLNEEAFENLVLSKSMRPVTRSFEKAKALLLGHV
jgi:hypothetical protein